MPRKRNAQAKPTQPKAAETSVDTAANEAPKEKSKSRLMNNFANFIFISPRGRLALAAVLILLPLFILLVAPANALTYTGIWLIQLSLVHLVGHLEYSKKVQSLPEKGDVDVSRTHTLVASKIKNAEIKKLIEDTQKSAGTTPDASKEPVGKVAKVVPPHFEATQKAAAKEIAKTKATAKITKPVEFTTDRKRTLRSHTNK